VLWISVYCQQFFHISPGSAFFEVQGAGSHLAVPSGDVNLEAIKDELGRAITQAEEEERYYITEPEEACEPHPWLRRVGWVGHLERFDREELRELVVPVEDDEPEL
jgi:hypothetical protein